jgi:hypothetical protein
MLGNDGRRYYFAVQTATPYVTRSDERVMQLHWLVNRLLERNHQAQRRSLALHIPVVVPITPRLRLMEDHRELRSLGEVYDADRFVGGCMGGCLRGCVRACAVVSGALSLDALSVSLPLTRLAQPTQPTRTPGTPRGWTRTGP